MARNSEVNFRLKSIGHDGKGLIYLQFLFNKQRLFFSFGQKIAPANWNPNKQRVKKNSITTLDGRHSLNDLLDNLERECYRAYNHALKDGIPTPEHIKTQLQEFLNHNETKVERDKFYSLVDRFINNEIKYKGRLKSPNTIKTYKTLRGHLQAFDLKERKKTTFETVTLDFYYKYTSFLNAKGLSANAISKDIQILKVIMGEAVDLGLTSNLQCKHKKFAVSRDETDAIFLTENELLKIYRHDFSTQPRLERVRDLFVFGSYVGLRFSDYSDVKPDNIVTDEGDLFIKMITKKTGELVIIPCNPIVVEIFNKYGKNTNKLPKAPSNQKFNDYIKEVCKQVGLIEKGRLSTEPTKQLWECVTSHTARRSFATNYYLSGFPTIDLMKITGHKTEKAFMKYIRITKLDTAKRLNIHIKKNWSEKLLRVA